MKTEYLKTQLETAAEWAASTTYADIPKPVLEVARLQIANMFAAALAGSRSAAGRKARAGLSRTWVKGPCTVIPHGDNVSVFDAVYLHAAYSNALELDDFLYRGHLGQAVVFVPLALAEAFGYDGKQVLTAQVVANEVAGRLGAAITADILHGHQRSYLQRLAAAVCTAKLLSLNQEKFTNALAIAMTQPEYPLHPGEFSPETKIFSASSSVVEGMRAAFLAMKGISAASDILEHQGGFYRQFTFHDSPPNAFLQFGDAWLTQTLAFKRYSSCAYANGAVDCVRLLSEEQPFELNEIETIKIFATAPTLILERLSTPHLNNELTPVNVQFSVARSVAMALLYGDLRGFHFTPDSFQKAIPTIQALSAKTEVKQDWELTIQLLRGLDDGLSEGGSKHSAGMLEFYKASRQFHKRFGSDRSLSLRDIPQLLTLPTDDRRYLVKRFLRGFQSKFSGEIAGGPFGDVSKLSWRMGSRIELKFKSGKVMSAEKIIPPGMAGDPNRAEMVKEKLVVEARPVIGERKAKQLLVNILHIEKRRIADVISLSSH